MCSVIALLIALISCHVTDAGALPLQRTAWIGGGGHPLNNAPHPTSWPVMGGGILGQPLALAREYRVDGGGPLRCDRLAPHSNLPLPLFPTSVHVETFPGVEWGWRMQVFPSELSGAEAI